MQHLRLERSMTRYLLNYLTGQVRIVLAYEGHEFRILCVFESLTFLFQNIDEIHYYCTVIDITELCAVINSHVFTIYRARMLQNSF